MWLMSTFEKGNQKKIFFVSTFLDWYNLPFKIAFSCAFKNIKFAFSCKSGALKLAFS